MFPDHEIVNFGQGTCLAFIMKLGYTACQLGLLRGRHHEAFLEGGARPWLSGLSRFATGPRRSRNGPSGQYDPCGRSFALPRSRLRDEREKRAGTSPKGMPHAAMRCANQKSPRWSAGGEPPSLGGAAPLMVPRASVMTRKPGAQRGTRAPAGAPPTPYGGSGNDATRPRSDAGEKERKGKGLEMKRRR